MKGDLKRRKTCFKKGVRHNRCRNQDLGGPKFVRKPNLYRRQEETDDALLDQYATVFTLRPRTERKDFKEDRNNGKKSLVNVKENENIRVPTTSYSIDQDEDLPSTSRETSSEGSCLKVTKETAAIQKLYDKLSESAGIFFNKKTTAVEVDSTNEASSVNTQVTEIAEPETNSVNKTAVSESPILVKKQRGKSFSGNKGTQNSESCRTRVAESFKPQGEDSRIKTVVKSDNKGIQNSESCRTKVAGSFKHQGEDSLIKTVVKSDSKVIQNARFTNTCSPGPVTMSVKPQIGKTIQRVSVGNKTFQIIRIQPIGKKQSQNEEVNSNKIPVGSQIEMTTSGSIGSQSEASSTSTFEHRKKVEAEDKTPICNKNSTTGQPTETKLSKNLRRRLKQIGYKKGHTGFYRPPKSDGNPLPPRKPNSYRRTEQTDDMMQDKYESVFSLRPRAGQKLNITEMFGSRSNNKNKSENTGHQTNQAKTNVCSGKVKDTSGGGQENTKEYNGKGSITPGSKDLSTSQVLVLKSLLIPVDDTHTQFRIPKDLIPFMLKNVTPGKTSSAQHIPESNGNSQKMDQAKISPGTPMSSQCKSKFLLTGNKRRSGNKNTDIPSSCKRLRIQKTENGSKLGDGVLDSDQTASNRVTHPYIPKRKKFLRAKKDLNLSEKYLIRKTSKLNSVWKYEKQKKRDSLRPRKSINMSDLYLSRKSMNRKSINTSEASEIDSKVNHNINADKKSDISSSCKRLKVQTAENRSKSEDDVLEKPIKSADQQSKRKDHDDKSENGHSKTRCIKSMSDNTIVTTESVYCITTSSISGSDDKLKPVHTRTQKENGKFKSVNRSGNLRDISGIHDTSKSGYNDSMSSHKYVFSEDEKFSSVNDKIGSREDHFILEDDRSRSENDQSKLRDDRFISRDDKSGSTDEYSQSENEYVSILDESKVKVRSEIKTSLDMNKTGHDHQSDGKKVDEALNSERKVEKKLKPPKRSQYYRSKTLWKIRQPQDKTVDSDETASNKVTHPYIPKRKKFLRAKKDLNLSEKYLIRKTSKMNSVWKYEKQKKGDSLRPRKSINMSDIYLSRKSMNRILINTSEASEIDSNGNLNINADKKKSSDNLQQHEKENKKCKDVKGNQSDFINKGCNQRKNKAGIENASNLNDCTVNLKSIQNTNKVDAIKRRYMNITKQQGKDEIHVNNQLNVSETGKKKKERIQSCVSKKPEHEKNKQHFMRKQNFSRKTVRNSDDVHSRADVLNRYFSCSSSSERQVGRRYDTDQDSEMSFSNDRDLVFVCLSCNICFNDKDALVVHNGQMGHDVPYQQPVYDFQGFGKSSYTSVQDFQEHGLFREATVKHYQEDECDDNFAENYYEDQDSPMKKCIDEEGNVWVKVSKVQPEVYIDVDDRDGNVVDQSQGIHTELVAEVADIPQVFSTDIRSSVESINHTPNSQKENGMMLNLTPYSGNQADHSTYIDSITTSIDQDDIFMNLISIPSSTDQRADSQNSSETGRNPIAPSSNSSAYSWSRNSVDSHVISASNVTERNAINFSSIPMVDQGNRCFSSRSVSLSDEQSENAMDLNCRKNTRKDINFKCLTCSIIFTDEVKLLRHIILHSSGQFDSLNPDLCAPVEREIGCTAVPEKGSIMEALSSQSYKRTQHVQSSDTHTCRSNEPHPVALVEAGSIPYLSQLQIDNVNNQDDTSVCGIPDEVHPVSCIEERVPRDISKSGIHGSGDLEVDLEESSSESFSAVTIENRSRNEQYEMSVRDNPDEFHPAPVALIEAGVRSNIHVSKRGIHDDDLEANLEEKSSNDSCSAVMFGKRNGNKQDDTSVKDIPGEVHACPIAVFGAGATVAVSKSRTHDSDQLQSDFQESSEKSLSVEKVEKVNTADRFNVFGTCVSENRTRDSNRNENSSDDHEVLSFSLMETGTVSPQSKSQTGKSDKHDQSSVNFVSDSVLPCLIKGSVTEDMADQSKCKVDSSSEYTQSSEKSSPAKIDSFDIKIEINEDDEV